MSNVVPTQLSGILKHSSRNIAVNSNRKDVVIYCTRVIPKWNRFCVVVFLIVKLSVGSYAQDPSVLRNSSPAMSEKVMGMEIAPDTLKKLTRFSVDLQAAKRVDSVRQVIVNLSSSLQKKNDSLTTLALNAANAQKNVAEAVKRVQNEKRAKERATREKELVKAELKAREARFLEINKKLEQAEGAKEIFKAAISLTKKLDKLRADFLEVSQKVATTSQSVEAGIERLEYLRSKLEFATSMLDTVSKKKMEQIEKLSTYNSNIANYIRTLEGIGTRLDKSKSFFSLERAKEVDLDTTRNITQEEITKVAAAFPSVKKEFLTEETNLNKAIDDFNIVMDKKKKIEEGIETFFKDLGKSGSETTESEIGALPSLVSTLGDVRQLNLNVNVLASFKKSMGTKNYIYAEGRLFTTNSQPLTNNNMKSFFLPEASPFGFQIKTTYGNKYELTNVNRESEKKMLKYGFTGQCNFLTKKFVSRDSVALKDQDFSIFFIHAKVGMEAVLIEKTLGIYGNRNWLSAVDNLADFERNFFDKNKSYKFWELGLRGLLGSKNVKEGWSLSVDLGFILAERQGREFISTIDKAYPVFRFGLLKSLGHIYE